MNGDVTMTVPAGTQSNKFMRLGGKGMPKLKSDGHGDEYVRLDRHAADRTSATKRRSSSANSPACATAKRERGL